MTYLYGDSTPSPLKENFIDLLRRALDLSVELVRAEHRLAAEEEQRRQVKWQAEADLVALHRLEEVVARTAREAAPAFLATPAARCAETIADAARDAVQQEIGKVEQAM